MKKALAYVGITAALLGGTVACQPAHSSSTQYVDEVQYGYYDAGYSDAAHYHYYSHPKQVRVTRSQYTAHKYEYAPHGTQHKVTVKHTTTTTHHSDGSKTTTHKRTVTRHSSHGSSHTTTRRSTTRTYRKH